VNAATDRVELRTFVRGFDLAHKRLRGRVSREATPDEVFLPLFDTLNWAVALIDLARDLDKEIKADPDDLWALRLARNRSHHQWANVLTITDVLNPEGGTTRHGGTRPGSGRTTIVRPITVQAWAWKEFDALPPPDPEHPDRLDSIDAYKRRLERQVATGVLSRLSEGLARHR
jgi:hypothetical protein